ncbi:PilN domain-containing protein [Paenibacillus sp. MBLB4367]|uniref:PilN domain-containing protein n=1 Tax=Paenibacillus sp. MBLB4367 TaxID=3384767 RepID=UPI0039083D28
MRSINLLPRIPIVQRLFVPLLAGTVLIFGCSGVAITYVHFKMKTDAEQQKHELAELDKQIGRLTAERQIDAGTQTYRALLDETKKLSDARMDWQAVMQELTSPLPSASRLSGLSAKAEKLSVILDFSDMKAAAEYVRTLQKQSLFDSVAIKSAEVKAFTPQLESAQSLLPQGIDPVPDVAVPSLAEEERSEPAAPIPSAEAVTAEQLTEAWLKNKKVERDSADSLLQQLDWMMYRQQAKERYGISLPERPAAAGSTASSAPYGTPAPTPSPSSATRSVPPARTPTPAPTPSPTVKPVNIVQLSLDIVLKPVMPSK